jgi:N-acetylneuraminic acid mutarotase
MTANPVWIDLKSEIKERRQGAVGFCLNGRVFVGLGTNGTTEFNDFYEFDLHQRKYIRMADFPGTARASASAFVVNNIAYVVGGGGGGSLTKQCWAYDPYTNAWYARADFPGTARQDGVALAYGNLGYYGLGYDGGYRTDWYAFNPVTNSWSAKASYGGPGRSEATGFVIGSRGYVGYGWNGVTDFKTWFYYDFIGNTWTATATDNNFYSGASKPYRKAMAIAIDGYGWVFGGGNQSGFLQTTEKAARKFDPAGSGSWTKISDSDLPDYRKDGVLVLCPGKLILVGGSIHQQGGVPPPPGVYHYTNTERQSQTWLAYIDAGLRLKENSKDSPIAIACEPYNALTSALRFAKNGQIYGVSLVPVESDNASSIRIQTAGGLKALEKIRTD